MSIYTVYVIVFGLGVIAGTYWVVGNWVTIIVDVWSGKEFSEASQLFLRPFRDSVAYILCIFFFWWSCRGLMGDADKRETSGQTPPDK